MNSVTVMISTYNGEKFLKEQIESILSQTNVKVKIFVRDDGSVDGTRNILNDYQNKGKLTWYCGNNLKTARSFLDIVKNVPKDSYYAFSDQDDVWKKNKLERAIEQINANDTMSNNPTLYTCNYELVDENLTPLTNKKHVTTTNFGGAIAYSCCTGCTMVFNNDLMSILKKSNLPSFIIMHDDWIHKVCLAVNGKVIYDSNRMLYYRQHKHNVEGGLHSFKDKIKRFYEHSMGYQKFEQSRQLEELLRLYGSYMNDFNKTILKEILRYRDLNLLDRIKIVKSANYKTPYKNLGREFKIYVLLKCW